MWQFLGRDVPIDHSHQTASSPALPMMVSKGATPCTHCCYAQLTHARGFHAMRVQPKRNLKPMLLPGSQRAGSPSFLPHAAADDTQPSRGQPNSRPRPPLQRQRPGPQRPMDTRQRKQRPERQTPPLRHEPDGQMAQQGSGSPGQLPAASSPQRGIQQRKAEDRVAPVGSPPRQMTAVHFCLQFDTQYGQRIRLVGSHSNLGQLQLYCFMLYCRNSNVHVEFSH